MKHALSTKRMRLYGMVGLASLFLHGAVAQEVISIPKKVFGTGPVNTAAYSPDGKLIVTGNSSGAYLWDAVTGNQLRRLPGPMEEFGTVAFSPDGTQFATGSSEHYGYGWRTYIRLWSVSSGGQIWEASPPQGVSQIAFSPNGHSILGRSSSVFLWRVATGQLEQTLTGQYEILDAAFSPDSSLVVTGSGDDRARLWDVATGQELRVLRGHAGRVDSVVFSPDGSKVLTGSTADGTARLWDSSSGTLLHTFWNDYLGELPEPIVPVTFSPAGDKVLTGAAYWVRLWNTQTGQMEQEWEWHAEAPYDDPYCAIPVFRDGMKALVVSNLPGIRPPTSGSIVKLVDLSNETTVATIASEFDVEWATLSPDGALILTIGGDTTLWNAASGQKVGALGYQSELSSLALTADGTLLATGEWNEGTIVIWNVHSGREQCRFQSPSPVLSLGFSADGSKLFGTEIWSPAVNAAAASVWNPQTGELIRRLVEPDTSVWGSGQFTADGRQIALGGAKDGEARISLWDIETGTRIGSFVGPPAEFGGGFAVDVDFSPDEDRIVGAFDNQGVCMYDVTTGSLLQHFTVDEDRQYIDRASSARFSPDGEHVLVGLANPDSDPDSDYPDRTLLLDAETLQLERTFLLGSESYYDYGTARFSPDGRWFLAGGWVERRILDTVTGEHLYTLPGAWGYWTTAKDAFSPDGRTQFGITYSVAAVWELVPAPELTIQHEADNRIVLTWQSPADILQQRPDLDSDDWTDVTLTTPGRYEFTNPSGTTFYRLKEP